ncbi:tetratricopeptide repeat protein [Streptomyces sp. NPDC020917]|uniref:tetratricopeptide repeat protein n=1 Tax=Streptomyces sp. NPDC020917 TaxID=3365102 RepID=UPI0037A5D910
MAAGGDIQQVTLHPAQRTPAVWPHQVGEIPPRAGCFQHRAEIVRLRSAVHTGGTAVLGQVLTGMGGVGKTQLAADYARTAWAMGEIDVLVWITAGSRTAAINGYARAGVEMLGADPGDPDWAAAAFLAWLEPKPQKRLCRWLVVLDDVADPADLDGLWPPDSPTGRTLITTRRRDAALSGHGRRLVSVGLFTPGEAAAYLAAALAIQGRTEPPSHLAALADDLGHLPLALSQAAAYLVDAAISSSAYRMLLADRARDLAETVPDRLPDGQSHTMAAAWALSVDHADQLRPAGLARPMLQLMAFFDPNGIPASVVHSAPARDYLRVGWSSSAAANVGGDVTAAHVHSAVRVLHRLSLVDHDPDAAHRAVRVHQVIQRAVRDTLSRPEQEAIARIAADALTAAWPGVERDTDLAQALRANATALARTADDALHRPNVHALLYRCGNSIGVAGQAAAAADHFQRLTDAARHHLGPDHVDTLAARHDLAYWRGAAGDVTGAVVDFDRLLADRLRVLGPDHPHTLTTRGNLAYWQGGAGDVANATAALNKLLVDRLRVSGPDHPDTLSTRHDIARFRQRGGDVAGAAAELSELLADRLRVLGPDHPDTLSTRHDLACWRGDFGDVVGGAAELLELLADRLRVLGPDHPDTLTTRHHQSRLRGKSGDAAGAVADFEALLGDVTRVLGPDHPQTLDVRHNIAYWREETEVVTLLVRPRKATAMGVRRPGDLTT